MHRSIDFTILYVRFYGNSFSSRCGVEECHTDSLLFARYVAGQFLRFTLRYCSVHINISLCENKLIWIGSDITVRREVRWAKKIITCYEYKEILKMFNSLRDFLTITVKIMCKIGAFSIYYFFDLGCITQRCTQQSYGIRYSSQSSTLLLFINIIYSNLLNLLVDLSSTAELRMVVCGLNILLLKSWRKSTLRHL